MLALRLLAITLLFSTGFATEKRIAHVICEPQQNAVHELLLNVDDQANVASLIRRSMASQSIFSSIQLQQGDVVIANTKGKDVLCLSCPDYNPRNGGFVILKYLYNGLTNNYKAFYMILEKEGNEWVLYTPPPQKQKIHTLRLKPRTFAGILVGIQGIEINR